MNIVERIYWNFRFFPLKKRVFISGYAEINQIQFFSKEEIIKHYFLFNKSHNDGFCPSYNCFWGLGYLCEYPDVAKIETDPWIHYVMYGKKEGRDNGLNPPCELFFKEGYVQEYPDVGTNGLDPWQHYVLYGKQEGLDNGLHPSKDTFNDEIYKFLYADIRNSEVNPWVHYVLYGKKEERSNGIVCKLIRNIILSNS